MGNRSLAPTPSGRWFGRDTWHVGCLCLARNVSSSLGGKVLVLTAYCLLLTAYCVLVKRWARYVCERLVAGRQVLLPVHRDTRVRMSLLVRSGRVKVLSLAS